MRRLLAIAAGAVGAAGCIDSFHGSNVQFDFSQAMPVQASEGATPQAGELPANIHFTFYAFQDGFDAQMNPVGRLFEIQQLEVHRIVDLSSPCFIDVGEHVPFPGLHVSQYANMVQMQTGIADLSNPPPGATEAQKIAAATAVQRMANIALLAGDNGVRAITDASTATYPAVATDCIGPGIPPPTCTDNASNERRLQQCQAFWKANKTYFEGTDRVLTAPLNGTVRGVVDGRNPINQGLIGGAQFYVNTDLAGIPGYAIYYQDDGMPDPGNLLLYGTATTPTRGVTHVHMTSPTTPGLTTEVAIFANLDQDNTSF